MQNLTRSQDCLSRVPTLKVVCLDAYPTCCQEEASCELRHVALQHVLNIAVDKIFQTLVPNCPDFLAVIIHANEGWSFDSIYALGFRTCKAGRPFWLYRIRGHAAPRFRAQQLRPFHRHTET